MIPRFGLAKGANRWRVVEFIGVIAGIPEYRYASDPVKTKHEAVAAYKRLTLARDIKLVNPMDENF